jgi:hypothetical protein
VVTETKVGTLKEIQSKTKNEIAYKFRDEWELTEEQLTDPDYSMKLIAKRAGIDPNKMLICSKCHHCR